MVFPFKLGVRQVVGLQCLHEDGHGDEFGEGRVLHLV